MLKLTIFCALRAPKPQPTIQAPIAVICFAKACSSSKTTLSQDGSPEAALNYLCPADRNITNDRLRELKSFASEDATYKQVVNHTIRGFPNLQAHDIPVKLQPYFKVQGKLTTDWDGFLVRNDAFVVPHALVPRYLKRLLSMHLAALKMLARACRSLWWPYQEFCKDV
jgi:hypothetical protein